MSPRLGEVVLSTQSDERLLRLARAGHERAFAVIVERYRPELYALARRLSPDGKGEDIVQQAFLSAFAALRSGAEVGHLRGWLYAIVRNAAARSYAPLCMPLDGGAASDESVEDVVQQREVAMNALAELARLPKRQRQAMVGTALDGRGRAEVASSMGVSEGAVRQLVHRARATLRTAVTAVTPWPLARLLATAGPGGGRTAEVAAGVGAGAASSGGVALKLGIVLASGAIATGVAAVGIRRGEGAAHQATLKAATRPVHAQAARGHDHLVTVAMVLHGPAVIQGAVSEQSPPAGARAAAGVRVRQGRVGAAGATEPHGQGGGTDSRGGSGRRDAGRSGLGAGVDLRGGRGSGSGAGSRGAGGSGRSDGDGSERGDGGGSDFGDRGGSRGGAGSGWGDGGGSGYAGRSGLPDGGGWRGGGSGTADGGGGGGGGPNGGSLASPQATIANDGFSRSDDGWRGGGGGGYGGSGTGSGPGSGTVGSGSGAVGSGSGAVGSGSGSGSVGGGSGSGAGPAASGAGASASGAGSSWSGVGGSASVAGGSGS